MCKFVVFISLILILGLFSCSNEEKPYSYLCESDTVAETVSLVFSCSNDTSVFRYTIQSREMCIHWGYSSAPNDYMFFGNQDSIQNIKSIVHSFPSKGKYKIDIKALSLVELNLAKHDLNDITSLDLQTCNNLKRLNCVGQPIIELDLTGCSDLIDLSCGYMDGLQTLSDIGKLKKIENLSINGPINFAEIDLSPNDSIKTASFVNSNITDLKVADLKALSSVTINNCSDFQHLLLANNTKLKELTFTNNIMLDSEALNMIFEALPPAMDNNSIILKGNKGDALCDKSVAIAKGWNVSVN